MDSNYKGEVIKHDVAKYVPETEYVVKVLERHVEKAKHNLKGAPIVVAGGCIKKTTGYAGSSVKAFWRS